MSMTLRKFVDALSPLPRLDKSSEDLKVGDQVVVKKATRLSGPRTQEVMVGSIAAFSESGRAIVSLARPGGAILRTEVPVDQLIPVENVHKRAGIPVNPAFRKVF